MKTVLLALACAAAALPQNFGVQAPLAGRLFDPSTGAIRPILGAPGAALLGPPLPFPAWITPSLPPTVAPPSCCGKARPSSSAALMRPPRNLSPFRPPGRTLW